MNSNKNRTEYFIRLGPFSIHLRWSGEPTVISDQCMQDFYSHFLISSTTWKESNNKHMLEVTNEILPEKGLAGKTIGLLDRELRKWVSQEARVDGGFSVHSAGAIMNHIGVMMPGVSGAGKTTLVTKLEPLCQLVLSDDRCVILPNESGEWTIWGTPFFGTGRQGITGPGVTLKALLFPVKKPNLRIIPLEPLSAVKRFLAAVVISPVYRNGKELTDATDLIESVNCFEVEYSLETPTREVFDAIRTAL